jgi:hypothetical protein
MMTSRPENQDKPNGIQTLLRIDVLAFIVQTVVLLATLIYGYSKLEAKVEMLSDRLNQHIESHQQYLLKESWELRNKFIDAKLDSIASDLKTLLMQQKIDTDRDVRAAAKR